MSAPDGLRPRRRPTPSVDVGGVLVGSAHPVVVQSMTNTDTADADATALQVARLAQAGSQLVRVTVNNEAAAAAVPDMVRKVRDLGFDTPIVGDFHYNGHQLLVAFPEAARALAKYRINPGNVGAKRHDENFQTIIRAAIEHDKAVRIGVNWGSLDAALLTTLMEENARLPQPLDARAVMIEAMLQSALRSAELAEETGLRHDRLIISAKVSGVRDLVDVYRLLAARCDYALHLGLTEAGMGMKGIVASTAGLGILLNEGIGDTIRVSLTPEPGAGRELEVEVAQQVLQSLGLRSFMPQVSACPGCGRTTSTFFQEMARDIQQYLKDRMPEWRVAHPGVEDLRVAVMGCVVNGPGESKHADIGISLPGTFEEPVAPVFVDGKLHDTFRGDDIVERFVALLEEYVARRSPRQAFTIRPDRWTSIPGIPRRGILRQNTTAPLHDVADRHVFLSVRRARWTSDRDSREHGGVRMSRDFVGALLQLNAEKGVPREHLIRTIEDAIESAYRRIPGNEDVRVRIDPERGEMMVTRERLVVEEIEDELTQITVAAAAAFEPDAAPGDVVVTEQLGQDAFGRIGAQTAKQVVLQRLREAERDVVFDQFASREGDLITGTVNRVEPRAIILDLGKAEAILATTEQSPVEHYRIGQNVKAFVLEVRRAPKGPQVFVSRTHKGFLRRLFELEVPEIHAGTVEIKAISRDAGSRSKVAVASRQEGLDPVGATVGQRGSRVQAVVAELAGEKIDVIEWHEDPAIFVAKALSPAQVDGVVIDEENRVANVTVPERMLSLAIGRGGQNASLAAKLTGWRINIRSDVQGHEPVAAPVAAVAAPVAAAPLAGDEGGAKEVAS